MAEEWDWSDLEDDDEQEQPKKVDPKDPKTLRQFARKTAKENEDLRKQIAEIHAASRKDNITSKVKAKNLPEKVAKLIPADVSVDKLDDWLNEYADLWTPSKVEGEEDVEEDDELVAEAAAYNRMSQATGATVPATRPNDTMAQIMDPTMTRDKLIQLIHNAGGGFGSG